MNVFTPLDLTLFFIALLGVMFVGLIAGRKEDTSEDYFLAGRKIPWWGVAGSIFGSNVSANHLVGMMGVGFSIGFFQSHFEMGAILGLMVLCYGFLPVYRRLGVYTLSEYLGARYDDRSRFAYAIIMIIIMVGVQMVPGLYIGSRTICELLGDDAVNQTQKAGIDVVTLAKLKEVKDVSNLDVAPKSTTEIKFGYYVLFVILLAAIAGGYTIMGGLKAVVWTDFIQSMLLLVAGLVIAYLAFEEIGGWSEMMAKDAAADKEKMHLYLPTHHPKLPWTGIFTGLLAMHCFYWGTNQFIVQRALGARSDSDARLGIIAAGFLKLLIPFFAIGGGVAAYYIFQAKGTAGSIAPDAAFSELVKLVIPAGVGLIGLIAAGLIGAILSSIDSMMNSAATIVTIDIYKKYFNPEASDKQMIQMGRYSIIAFMVLATLLAILIMDPNSKENFFLQIADYQNYLTPGLLVAFFMGIFWKRGTGAAAIATICAGVLFSWVAEYGYNETYGMPHAFYKMATDVPLETIKIGDLPKEFQGKSFETIAAQADIYKTHLNGVNRTFGHQLNFFHRVVFVLFFSVIVHVVISLLTKPDAEKGEFTWTGKGGASASVLQSLSLLIAVSIGFYAICGALMVYEILGITLAAALGAVWTLVVFQFHIRRNPRLSEPVDGSEPVPVDMIHDDRNWASLLCSAAIFMHYFFY
jgi:solute:Na+ symporter, SSS family